MGTPYPLGGRVSKRACPSAPAIAANERYGVALWITDRAAVSLWALARQFGRRFLKQ